MHSSRTATDTAMSPAGAAAQSRAASWTAAPNRSSLSSVTGSPALIPTLTSIGVVACSLRACSCRCTSIANATEDTTDVNAAMMPSPVCLTSRPPFAASALRTISLCSPSNFMCPSSPSSCVWATEPHTSVNTIARIADSVYAVPTG